MTETPKAPLNTTLREAISAEVVSKLAAKGVPHARIKAKTKATGKWWAVAGLFVLGSLGFAGLGVYVALQKDMTIILSIILGGPVVFCMGGALFCASQASAEATKAALTTILDFARGARRLGKPEEKP